MNFALRKNQQVNDQNLGHKSLIMFFLNYSQKISSRAIPTLFETCRQNLFNLVTNYSAQHDEKSYLYLPDRTQSETN